MATNIKFIATTSDKLDSIPIKTGQIIFSRDNRTIYLDSDERTAFQQIITLDYEEERQNLISPVNRGFYFVEDTTILWNYSDGFWYQLTQKPDEKIVFDDKPVTGKANTLYVENGQIYQWNTTSKSYQRIAVPSWEAIV